ncbi:MAG: heavy metal translocating P-type ATPase [Acidobacteriota bacterium]|jgi:heavy metal translocating P-type ATPase|nr:heavy metal translocating P-type ATPase [Acidobacteriota bacterium]
MSLTVASDIPGRLRVRFGRHAFSGEQVEALELAAIGIGGVSFAQASHRTGSLLVYYEGNVRSAILERLARGGVAELVESAALTAVDSTGAPSSATPFIDPVLRKKLSVMIARRFAVRYLVPRPIRMVLTVFRAIGFIRKGIARLFRGRVDVDVLDASAVSAAMLRGKFDTADSIMFLLSVSEVMEKHTLEKTRNVLFESLRFRIERVWALRDGVETSVPFSEVAVGDLVVVRTGSSIPVDGEVIDGEAEVNESAMTGEPMAAFKKAGDSVFAGTVLEDGRLVVKVRVAEGGTRIRHIMSLIEESDSRKASVQGRAEALADRLAPYNFLLAMLVYAATGNVSKALSVLLVDYSCAIRLATPITVMSAMREASEHGMVVRGGRYLEEIAVADVFIFDKTGTLTLAEPHVRKVVSLDGRSQDETLRLAACIEEHFPHSVARAIVRAAKDAQLHHEEEHAEVQYVAAHGIVTSINGHRALIGSRHFLFEDEGVPLTDKHRRMLDDETDSVVCLAMDGHLAGYITIDDPPRPEAAEAVAALRSAGVAKIIMLTGDGEKAAERTCGELGIDVWRSGLLPEDKAAVIRELQAEGHTVAMVGDGINDAPALAQADVGIAIGSGTDVAMESADIVLMRSDLADVATAIDLSKRTIRNIKQNRVWAFGYNVIGIPIAAGVLYLFGGPLLNPIFAAAAMSLSSVSVLTNALRLKRFKPTAERAE